MRWYLSGQKDGTTIAGWWFRERSEAVAFYRKMVTERPDLRYKLEQKR